jgi:hypothetical protein
VPLSTSLWVSKLSSFADSFRYFGEKEVPECEYACDWHKDAAKLKRAKQNGLQSEEWVSTQREMGRYDSGYDGYD